MKACVWMLLTALTVSAFGVTLEACVKKVCHPHRLLTNQSPMFSLLKSCDDFSFAAIKFCDSLPCQHGATCTDIPGDFECTCAPGYTGLLCDIGNCLSDTGLK